MAQKMSMKQVWFAGVFLATAVLLGGCATTKLTADPVVDPDQRVVGPGFSVLPPHGSQWFVMMRPDLEGVAFGKKDPEFIKSRGSVVVVARRAKALHNDISTPNGLQAEIEASARASPDHSPDRFTLRELILEPYRDVTAATDCVRIRIDFEERNNPVNPGAVLSLSDTGYVCRHPLSPGHYVWVTISERRLLGSPSLLDDSLRAEGERTLKSILFLPAP